MTRIASGNATAQDDIAVLVLHRHA